MAGAGWSALGAALTNGYSGFAQRKHDLLQENQLQFENTRQKNADTRAEQEAADAHATALMLAKMNQKRLDDEPKDDAIKSLGLLETLYGKSGSLDQPGMPDLIRQATGQAPSVVTMPPGPWSDEAKTDQAASGEGNNGTPYAPHTGLAYTPEMIATQQAAAEQRKARNALFSGQAGGPAQTAALYGAAGVGAMPAGVLDTGQNWVIEKSTDPITGATSFHRINKATGQTGGIGGNTGAPATGGGAGAPRFGENQPHGEDFLKTLDPATQARVKQYADYKGVVPTGMSLSKPAIMRLGDQLAQYDPDFSWPQYKTRQTMMNNYTSGGNGSTAAAITSFNQALSHIEQLRKDVKDLNNSNVTPANWLKNETSAVFGGTGKSNFNTTVNAIAAEASKFFKGISGTDDEIQAWKQTMSPNMSPEQMSQGLDRLSHLLAGKANPLAQQWQATMGTRPVMLTTPESAQLLKQSGVDENSLFMQPQFQGGQVSKMGGSLSHPIEITGPPPPPSTPKKGNIKSITLIP